MSTHVSKQLLSYIVPSILTLDFDLILGIFFLLFGALMGFFGVGGLGYGSKTVLGSTHVIEQLSFFLFLQF